jgi:hypothetical protein
VTLRHNDQIPTLFGAVESRQFAFVQSIDMSLWDAALYE